MGVGLHAKHGCAQEGALKYMLNVGDGIKHVQLRGLRWHGTRDTRWTQACDTPCHDMEWLAWNGMTRACIWETDRNGLME